MLTAGHRDWRRAASARMISMLVVGRLVGKVDARLLIGIGLALTALSLWQMTGFTLDSRQSGDRQPASSRAWASG